MIHTPEAAPGRAALSPRPAARPSPVVRPPALRSGSRAWLPRPGAPRARSPWGGGTRRRGAGRAKPWSGPDPGRRACGDWATCGQGARYRGMLKSRTRGSPGHCAWGASGGPDANCGRDGGRPPRSPGSAHRAVPRRRTGEDGAGESGRRAALRRREAPAGAGASAEDAAGLQGKARGGAAARSGPRCPPESARRDAATSLSHGAAGARPAPTPPPGQPLGPEPSSEAARTEESDRPQPALTRPRFRRRPRSCAPSSMVPPRRGRPAPPPRSTPHAAAPATPPPARPRPRPRPLSAGGPAGARGGLSAGSTNQRPLTKPLHQDWRAPQPMGKRKERGASAPKGGGLRRRWLSRSVLRPSFRLRLWP
ncbi:basic salivary proline-rich protein 2-like [Mustela lutreola]|uniref:basic salivary proline-rich protein 2-like n=1 Tax=Mustela lutreola TaxID=9666 RepID=UPI002797C869|nr:basic salivary proline-rich protein 2-like [Mustela lutreola]